MSAEGHLIFSVACAIFTKKAEATLALTTGDWWHIIPATLLTSLLPDIDHPQSLLGRRLRWLSIPISHAFGHRGFTHSLLAMTFFIILLHSELLYSLFIPIDALHAMIIGYCSHLLADTLTPYGVPLLWPCRWRFRLPLLNLFHKGYQWERIFCISLVAFALYWQSEYIIPVKPYLKKINSVYLNYKTTN